MMKELVVVLGILLVLVLPVCGTNTNSPAYIKDVVATKEGDGFQIYFVLADSNGQPTSSDGVLYWYITDSHNNLVSPVQFLTTEIRSTEFQNAKLGVGSFEHESLIYNIGRIPNSKLAGKLASETTGKVYVVLRLLPSGKELKGDTTIIF